MDIRIYDHIKENLILGVKNIQECKDKGIAYKEKGDFALIPQVFIDTPNVYNESFTINVTQDMVNMWNKSLDDVLGDAYANSKERFRACAIPIENAANFNELMPDDNAIYKAYLISNESFVSGGSTIFYSPNIIDDVIKQNDNTGEHTAVIIPTGENETFCVLVEKGKEEDAYMYSDFLSEVNEEKKQSSSYSWPISSEIYIYNSDEKNLISLDMTKECKLGTISNDVEKMAFFRRTSSSR